MTHIVVLGTSHTLQCGHSSLAPAAVARFESEVKSLATRHKIARVSEEMSPDGLARHGVSETVAARAARDLGLEYEAVDLSKSDRATLGIHDAPLFTIRDLYEPSDGGQAFRAAMFEIEGEIRERVWAFRIMSAKSSPVLFVCGASHVTPIARLWRMLGLPCDIAHHDFAV
jgi:hypothetical protein